MDSIETKPEDKPDEHYQIVKPGMICKHCKTIIPGGNCIIGPCNANPGHPYAHEWEEPNEIVTSR